LAFNVQLLVIEGGTKFGLHKRLFKELSRSGHEHFTTASISIQLSAANDTEIQVPSTQEYAS
jgi:hypothetical protein